MGLRLNTLSTANGDSSVSEENRDLRASMYDIMVHTGLKLSFSKITVQHRLKMDLFWRFLISKQKHLLLV